MKFYLINLESSDFFEISDQLSVGRKDKCDLVLKDDLVSGTHCKFHLKEHLLFIEDLNASNPVEVNNLQIESNSKVKIKNKDKIKIGSSEFYLSTNLPENELTYKSLILEKVKIHETFDSDLDFDQNEHHWNVNISSNTPQMKKRKPQTHKAPPKTIHSPQKEMTIVELQAQLTKTSKNISALNEKLSTTKKYSEEEILEKITLYTEKIDYYTKKRDELFAIQSLQEQLLELEKKKKEFELRVEKIKSKNDK